MMTNKTNIFQYKNASDLFVAAANKILAIAQNAVRQSGRFTIALSGGNTPKELFKTLAADPFVNLMPWEKTFVFWGDERVVAINSEENNAFVAENILLQFVDIPKENIFKIPVQQGAADASKIYENNLKDFFQSSLPSFDLVLLGLGNDGHTASLFPANPLLNEKDRLIGYTGLSINGAERVSFTLPLINAAKHIIFLITGKDKEPIFSTIQESEATHSLPASLINPTTGKLEWMVSF